MNKTQLLSLVRSCTQDQAQVRYDHVMVYLYAHTYYPRMRYVANKQQWFASVNADLGVTVQKMYDLGLVKLSDWHALARYLSHVHTLQQPNILRAKTAIEQLCADSTVMIASDNSGVDFIMGNSRFARNLTTDLDKLLV